MVFARHLSPLAKNSYRRDINEETSTSVTITGWVIAVELDRLKDEEIFIKNQGSFTINRKTKNGICYNVIYMTEEPISTQPQEGVSQVEQPAKPQKSKLGVGIIVILVLMVILFVAGIVALAMAPESTTAKVRDIFIIILALESLVLGVGMIILIIQLATLTNLLQNEIKPILDSTNETINHLRGTTHFLSNNLVEPVMKLNEYLAGIRKLIDFIRPNQR